MQQTNTEKQKLQIPEQMTSPENAWPIVYVQTEGLDLWRAPAGVAFLVSDVLASAIRDVHPEQIGGQGLLKVHIGERKCVTRMKPEYALGAGRFLRENGASGVVAGDTTVAYTGPRGHKSNPGGDCSEYLTLAQEHGWSAGGKAGANFVVLDRPGTSRRGEFEFSSEHQRVEVEGVNRFTDFYPAGGFLAADFIINHAHLTLHGLAGVAGCVKSIAMGCSGLKGKLRMHQFLLPEIDAELCKRCGRCVESCPEDALEQTDEKSPPQVDRQACIGCGECEAVCPGRPKAVSLQQEEVTDWEKGAETLPVRMADYTMGLMNGRWQQVVHLLHMYAVTELCDCVDVTQKPLIRRDLGFLVGKNPFAIDLLAGRMLTEALGREGKMVDGRLLQSAEITARYVKEAYGIQTEVPVQKQIVS